MASKHRKTIDLTRFLALVPSVWMRLVSALCFTGAAALWGLDCSWPRARGAEPAHETFFDRVTAPLVRTDLRLSGAASCSATACHGGPRAGTAAPTAARGSEYPLWLELDPHSRSWGTLCQPESSTILQRLGIMQGDKIVDQVGFDNCTACHNTTREFNEPRSFAPVHEGVGCASCHGPAEKWASTHFQANWDTASAVQVGFVPARNMLARARMCATCHVGDRDRDMNHDIIAAGHPPLLYEFSTFHLRQPKHWRDAGQADSRRYEASQWLAGQLASLDASLVLLETRAGQALPFSQWPEFSQLDCSACHQPVQLRNVNDQRPLKLAATALWSDWNNFGVRALLKQRFNEGKQDKSDQQLSQTLDALQAAMQARTGNARQAQQAARAARLALDAWIASAGGSAEIEGFTAERLVAVALAAGADPDDLHNWDRATQFYLAAMASRHSWAERDGTVEARTATARAERLRQLLRFETGVNSPAPFFRSLSATARRDLTVAVQELLQAMQPPLKVER